jgi:hypothetical protein
MEDDAANFSDMPIPGQSLTGKLGEKAYERPPEKPTVDENLSFYVESLLNPEIMPKLAANLDRGRTVSDFAEAVITSGVASGRHTIDVGVLVLPVVMEIVAYVGELYDVDYDMGLKAKSAESEDHFMEVAKKRMQEDEAADFEDDDNSAFTDFMPEDENEDMPIEEEAPDAPAIPTTGLMGRGV